MPRFGQPGECHRGGRLAGAPSSRSRSPVRWPLRLWSPPRDSPSPWSGGRSVGRYQTGAPGYWVRWHLRRIQLDVDRGCVEIVDEDLIRSRIPLGRHLGECISVVVVPSRDVMQLDSLELILQLTHLLVVCVHEGAFVVGLLNDLVYHSLESP
jgi:hypothetical protein